MDQAPAPQTPFELPPVQFYDSWDHRLSPRAYFERRFKCLINSVDDERTYSWKVLDYLRTKGAELVESSFSLSDKPAPSSEEISDVEMMMGDFPQGNGSYHLFWYRDNLVTVESSRDGGCSLDSHHRIGAPSVHDEFKGFLEEKKSAKVSILLNNAYGMTTKSVDFDPPVIDDLDLNYGAGFTKKTHEPIVAKLKEKKARMFLFRGPAGCGKTSYIKHLTTVIDRQFIFIPVSMAGELSTPAFLKLLMGEANSVLVLEDAEQALQSREVDHWNSSTVASLLNLSDGLLGTLLNISIIATYNAERQTIDKALLRKGRLAFDYTFDPLSVVDATKLASHLKKDIKVTEPMSLADIYNAEDDTNYTPTPTKVMGFGFS